MELESYHKSPLKLWSLRREEIVGSVSYSKVTATVQQAEKLGWGSLDAYCFH